MVLVVDILCYPVSLWERRLDIKLSASQLHSLLYSLYSQELVVGSDRIDPEERRHAGLVAFHCDPVIRNPTTKWTPSCLLLTLYLKWHSSLGAALVDFLPKQQTDMEMATASFVFGCMGAHQVYIGSRECTRFASSTFSGYCRIALLDIE